MQIVLCGLSEEVEAAMRRTLGDAPHSIASAPDSTAALGAMSASCPPSIVVAGGSSREALIDACRRLRAAGLCRDTIILAANAGPEDVGALIAAGADDFLIASNSDELLRGRLLVAMRAAEARAARRATERDWKQFFELSLDLLCVAGLDGYFKLVNPAWQKALGWSAAELLARPWLDFVHPDDRQLTLDAGARLGAGQDVIGFTNRYRCKDGSVRWLDWQSAPLIERGLIYCAVHDVTDARAAKEALRELSESLATTLNSIGDAVIAADLTGAVIRMNPIAERLTGWTLDEARGRPVIELLHLVDEETRGRVPNPIERALREGVIVTLAKHTLLQRRDGSEIAIADSCAPIKTDEGTVNGAVIVFRDLTAERSAEIRQARFQQQLVFADRMASVGTLAAGVAHEINNPLSYVTANVDIAIEELRGMDPGSGRLKEIEDMLSEARQGIARVTKIVRGLKTFSRIEEERAAVIDLVPVIELAINMSFNEIRHRARLVKDYGKLPLVEADDARLSQVFINLLVNAAHALPEENTENNEIRIVTSTDGEGRAVVEVRDTGPGIPPALLGRIFEPFFTTKPVGIGTGLGLAISHNIVTGMGGEISVQSELRRGTVFRVVLPPSSAREIAEPLVKRHRTKPPAPARSARVLVVDDEPAIGLAVRRTLRGHDVTVLSSAQDALDLLATGKEFDVVLSDLMMPGISGMELYRTMAVEHPKIASRVVFVTGGAFTREANLFLDQIVNERLEKPFDPNKLREMVEKFLP